MSETAPRISDEIEPTADGNPLKHLAEFAVNLSTCAIPSEVTEAVVRGVVDFVGVAIAGAVQPEMAPLVAHVRQTYAWGTATALGIPSTMTAEAAAYVNGAAGHVLDYDDCIDTLGGHPTVVVLPAVLALAEETGATAADALAAYLVGVEVESAIGRCLNLTHYERGWHPTATLGIFGAAAASARLMGADLNAMVRALAISASMSSGIKGNFGTFMKADQVGFAASKGVAAARLAMRGATANIDVFRSRHSFPAVFNGDEIVDWSPLKELGRHWSILSPGLIFKLYPCCRSTHGPLEAVLELQARGEIDPLTIESIDIYVHPRRLPHTNRPDPRDGLAGKFSVQYVVSVAALRGAVKMDDFHADRVNAQDVRQILRKVRVHELAPDDQMIAVGRVDCFSATVEIVDGSGKHRASVDAPRGSDPSLPVSDRELDGKFVDAASIAIGSLEAADTLDRLRRWCVGIDSIHETLNRVQQHLSG